MRWQKKLTKTQHKHLRETDARTLGQTRENVLFQAGNMFPCWDCVEIGRRLGIEVELTAFHERCEADDKANNKLLGVKPHLTGKQTGD